MYRVPAGTGNIFTVDLEEWFVVQALAGENRISDWTSLPSTVEPNTRRLLSLLHHYNVTATWFVMGWCAKEHPELIAEIVDAGHEIACHSYYHVPVYKMQRDEFRRDTLRAMHAIMEACGERPRGYRAPSWSIDPSVPWAFEVLAELGFEYDSSVFPIKHDLYGIPNGPREPMLMRYGERYLHEVPASTTRFLGRNLPAAGGGYLRHSPYWYTRWIINRLNRAGRPAVVYLHPWELDPDPPISAPRTWLQRLRSQGGNELLAAKVERLLNDYSFEPMGAWIARHRRQPAGFSQVRR